MSFRRCDIIACRHWCLGVRVSDSATVSDVVFSDIEVADLSAASPPAAAVAALGREPKLLHVTVVQDVWGKDPQRGRVRDVLVENVTVHGPPNAAMPPSELLGLDAEHDIRGVTLRNIRRAGRPAATDAEGLRLKLNEHVHGVRIEADP